MNNTQFKQRVLVVALLAIWADAGLAQVESEALGSKSIVSGEVDVAIRQTNVSGAREKFEENRDVRSGFVVNDLRLKADGVATPFFLDLKVRNPLQDNEFYQVNGGVHGNYKFGFVRDNIPHNFSSGRFLESDAGSGRYLISDAVQNQLQSAEVLRNQRLTGAGVTSTAGGAAINPADAQNMALDAAMRGIVNNLYNSATTIKFGLNRETTAFKFDYQLPSDATVWAKVSEEKRTGVRRINAGSYERYNNGVTTTTAGVGNRGHVADYFQVEGIELPETINYRTTTVSLGTGIHKSDWMLDASYTLTDFKNRVHSLTWDNPFRSTGAQATNADNSPGNAFNRFRSAFGQMTLPPDSQSHELGLSGAIDLPLHSKLTGNISYGWIEQNTAFDPYTLNTGVIANSVTGAPLAASLALPQSSLNGKVNTLFQSYQLTSKPVRDLSLAAKYRYYDYANKSSNITFPGYSGFGDSFWRTEKNDVSGGQDALVRNETLSFKRQNAELSVDYHLLKSVTLLGEAFWEGWDRQQLRIDGTSESGVGAGLIVKPSRTASVRANYRYAHRSVSGYITGNTKENPEAVGLVNYDWADRIRNKLDIRAQLLPSDAITVGLSTNYLEDKYGGDSLFGLKKNRSLIGAIDISYAPSEAVSLYLNLAREDRKGKMQSAAKDDSFDNPATAVNETRIGSFNPENYWNTDISEKVDTVGLGAMIQLIPSRLTLNAGYSLSNSSMDYTTSNPVPPKLLNAVAQAWPTVKNRLQEFKLDLAYNQSKNIKIGAIYLYEWYKLDDFTNTSAYLAGSTLENSTKYVYAGANNYKHDAHVLSAYLRYKF